MDPTRTWPTTSIQEAHIPPPLHTHATTGYNSFYMNSLYNFKSHHIEPHQQLPKHLQRQLTTPFLNLTVIALLITTAVAADTTPTGYTNHTVGGTAGWTFNTPTNIAATNYSSWAANQTFNLGDYLIFNTNTNQTVIQTYNETTFLNCTIDYSSDDDTFRYGGGDTEFGKPVNFTVPLTRTGINYFFSDAEDGVQCQRGMAFQISVNRGLGLPPSLNQPPPPPYVEPPPDSPPVTVDGVSPSLDNGAVRSLVDLLFLPSLVVVLLFGGLV